MGELKRFRRGFKERPDGLVPGMRMSAEVSFPINYEAATEVVVNKPKEPVASASTEELLTVRQAAKRYNVTPNTIRKWIACDLVAAIRVGPYRRIRLRASDIEAKH